MNLIDVYVQEVTRRLNEKNRKDIELELRSTIEDMLPDNYTEGDVKDVLQQLGNPAVLANGYSEKPMHLIGPRYYDVYMSLIKMILPIAAVVALISLVAENMFTQQDTTVLNIIINIFAEGTWRIVEVGMQTFFWLTIVFAVIERVDTGSSGEPITMNMKEWTPDNLKSVVYIPPKKAISNFDVFGSLFWTAIWATAYFYADHLFGVYEGGVFVTPAVSQSVLNSFWPLILVVIVMEVALAIHKMLKRQWTHSLAIFNTIVEVVGAVAFIVILTQPGLFEQEFLVYMADLFSMTIDQFSNGLIWGVLTIYLLAAVWNIIEGFRKAKIKS